MAKKIYHDKTGREVFYFDVPEKTGIVSVIGDFPLTKTSSNIFFASGQAIREASLTVLRPTVHGSETSRAQKRSLCGLAASSGVLNPRENKNIRKKAENRLDFLAIGCKLFFEIIFRTSRNLISSSFYWLFQQKRTKTGQVLITFALKS